MAASIGASTAPTGAQSQLDAPETPSSVTLSRADGTVTATWPAAARATSYHVTFSTNGKASWQLAALDHPAVEGENSITIEDADNTKTYIVGVRALNEAGSSGWRNSPSAGPYVPPPATPAGLAAAAGDGSVTLSWDDPSDSAITGYEFQMRYAGVAWSEWKAVPGSGPATVSHTVEGLDNGTEYRFKVRAVNAGSAGKPAPSAPPWFVAAVPKAPAPPPEPTPAPAVPGAPAGLAATAGDGSVALSWDDPSDSSITGYEYRMRHAGVAWSEWSAVPGSGSATVSHTVEGLDNGTEYRFKLRAVNDDGAGKPAPSAAPWFVAAVPKASAPPPTPAPAVPGALAGLAATAGDGSVALSWDDPSDSSITGYEYRMRRADAAWSEWVAVAGSDSSTVSHTVEGLDNGTEYRFKVRAVNSSGAGKPAPSAPPWFVAAVPNEATAYLTVTNPTPGVASMAMGGYSGQWYYRAQGSVPPGGGGAGAGGAGAASGAGQAPECVGPFGGGGAQITGLDNKDDYVFGAYSDAGCTAQIASASSQSGPVGRPGGVFEQFYGRTDKTLRVLWPASATSGAVYDVVYSSDGGQSWTRAATGISGAACTKDQLGGRTSGLCYTITGAESGTGNRMDNTATYIVGVRATKGGVSSWWRNSSALDPLPEPRVTAYPIACSNTTDYVLYMSWAKLPEAGITEQVRYKIGNGAWVNLPAEDSNTPDHRKIRGSSGRWLEWMDQLPAANSSYSVTAQVRHTGTLGNDNIQSTWGGETFNAGTSSDVKRWYTRCPAAPTRFVQSASTATSVTLTWNQVLGSNDYDIRYRERGVTAWTDAKTGHTTTSYTITGLTAGKNYRAQVRARNWDSAEASGWASLDFTAGVDYDTDNDRLIEIKTLAQLNAIRYDTDGNGQVASNNQSSYNAAFPNAAARTGTTAMGCPNTCQGYELAADLDFDTNNNGQADSGDTYYNSGSGWDPIGGYSTTLKGNGHRINGLYINRGYTSSSSGHHIFVGLFSEVSGSARLSGFALDNVDVYGAATSGGGNAGTPWVGALAGKINQNAQVSGISVSGRVRAYRNFVSSQYAIAGGLIGQNRGAVSGVSSTAYVEAKMGGNSYSGGDAGGIVGHNNGTIAESWFSGHVKGIGWNSARVGGIAGVSTGGAIKASYSIGTVDADVTGAGSDKHSGGIVGNLSAGSVEASYAAGRIIGDNAKGGITASSSGGTVTNSYYDSSVMGTLSSGRGTAKTTSELQTPTGYTGIYASWDLDLDDVTGDDDPWDFGTASEYPVLKSAPSALTVSSITLTTATLTFGNHNTAWWYKGDQSGANCTSVAAGTTTASLATLTSATTYTYKAYSNSGCTTEIGSATFTTTSVDYDTDDDRLIEIKTLAQLNAIRWDGDGNGQVASANQASYSTAFPNAVRTSTIAMGCPNTCQGYELAADLDFDTNSSGTADSGDTYWNSGSGWAPIASFNTTLKGNGHAIDNLHINRSYSNTSSSSVMRVGLFGQVNASARISGLALNNVDVYGATTDGNQTAAATRVGALAGETASGAQVSDVSVSGSVRTWRNLVVNSYANAGGLIGFNKGAVSRVSSTAYVEARMGSGSTGGDAGGIVSHNSGTIAESWFSGHAKGQGGLNARVGGIAAVQTGGSIKASYSTGTVEANATLSSGTSRLAGGIVGNLTAGTVEAVYAAGSVRGNTNQGGVTGSASGGTVTNSYYDSTVMGTLSGGRGTAKTTSELQTPTAYGTGSSIYANWNLNLDGVSGGDDPWDFGTSSEYPVLKSAPVVLSATSIAFTSATLAIGNHTDAWWYKGNQSGANCTSVTAGTTTAALTLTSGTTYTYTAYSDSGCNTELASATFATGSLSASAVTDTTATLTLSGHSGSWYVKKTAPTPAGSCSSAISGATYALTTLTAGTAYTYKAYSNSGCTTELATATFTTLSLAASAVTDVSATLTLSGHSGSWYVKKTAPTPAGSCSSAISGATHPLATLTAGTAYTYKAYSNSGCTTELATATFTTPSLTLTAVTGTTATLGLSGHSGSWYVKKTAPTAGSCSLAISGATHGLTGLTLSTTYTYKAYSNSGCTTEVATVTFSTTGGLTASSVTHNSASVAIDSNLTNQSGQWYAKVTTPPPGSPPPGSNCTLAISMTNPPTYSITTLTPGTTYTVKGYSDAFCTSGQEIATVTFTTLLRSPGSVGAQYQDGSLKVWWSRASGASGSVGYEVECSTDSGTSYTSCHTETASTTATFNVSPTGFTGTANKVRVRATQSSNNSAWVEVNVPSGTVGAPTNLVLASNVLGSGYSHTISWSKPSSQAGAVGYQVQCSTDYGVNWTDCHTMTAVTDATLRITKTNATQYNKVRVRSVVNTLVSGWTTL